VSKGDLDPSACCRESKVFLDYLLQELQDRVQSFAQVSRLMSCKGHFASSMQTACSKGCHCAESRSPRPLRCSGKARLQTRHPTQHELMDQKSAQRMKARGAWPTMLHPPQVYAENRGFPHKSAVSRMAIFAECTASRI